MARASCGTGRATLPCTALAALLVLTTVGRASAAPDEAPERADEPAASAESTADTADDSAAEDLMKAETFAGLKFRGIGPALMSGRVIDFAVDPRNSKRYFVAVASGGVWKTENDGTTYTPVFDKEKSFSIGCVTLDPRNPHVVWVGSGENNSQRSVSFGDGVYRSRDGGASWENLGLKDSEHIGRIVVHPGDSNTVYVAAQGPLWRSGGDRGLYKTTDGGGYWKRVLHISDDTGVNEVHMDPRDPNLLYASAYQRRRHVWTLINGGPESALYKSTDGGATWRKINSGLPKVDLGRIGLAISPVDPDVVYAVVEAADGEGGFFRSTDRGETWTKRSGYVSNGPQYYNELVCDPKNVDRVYSMDTFLMVTQDGGKSFQRVPNQNRHVDDHALWINPEDTDHMLVGCDGGVYDTYDGGVTWRYKANLPITQFYRVAVDNAEPFYNVYGGTQDNNTLGGPSRTVSELGIANEDWFVTVGGDGFRTVVDPKDPNIVYSEWQHGGLVRHDRRSGENVDIKPREAPGEDPLRWNWDSPLIISPHDHKRLYFAAQKLFRSDDFGNDWKLISPDLSRQIDRNKLKVMGKVQKADAVAKNRSTSIYGNCVALAESPLKEGLLYVGTDDGLIHVSEDGGANWRKESVFPGVPDMSYVSSLTASRHDDNVIYATFDNHKNGDFKCYVLRSDDRGQNWTSIAGDLPERNFVRHVAEDPVRPELLFVGTEYGVYFTPDGGGKWLKLGGGLPTIAVHDIAIQERENDLVLATFGRGFYVLDDYSPLRAADAELLGRPAALLPVKPALRYVESSRLGGPAGKGTQGSAFYAAPNPPFGATFTYYLKDKLTTRKERRKEAEEKSEKAGKTPKYPTIHDLRAEDEEREPSVLLIVQDSEGRTVRRVPGSRDKGLHRANWDLRYPSARPIELSQAERAPWEQAPAGPLALPGEYSVMLVKDVNGEVSALAGPVKFQVVPLDRGTFKVEDRAEVLAFQRRVSALQRAARGALKAADDVQSRLTYIRKAILETPDADRALLAEAESIQRKLTALRTVLRGDETLARREEPTPTSILERIEDVANSQWYSTAPPTKSQRAEYRIAGEQFKTTLASLRELVEKDLHGLEQKLETAGAPWTPGRLPVWEFPQD